jgi:hypothetical protein
MSVWQRLRRSDERIMDSPVGWLLPGGAAYKLGRRSATRGDKTLHLWPFAAGLLDGWNYNVGRERARRKQGLDHD